MLMVIIFPVRDLYAFRSAADLDDLANWRPIEKIGQDLLHLPVSLNPSLSLQYI